MREHEQRPVRRAEEQRARAVGADDRALREVLGEGQDLDRADREPENRGERESCRGPRPGDARRAPRPRLRR
jgi:hypothetical protein